MLSQVKSMCLLGLTGYLVTVQVDISNGLPMWDIVGLPDTSVRESKQRVHAALKNIGMALPSRKITINLAPAHLRKEGSYFDLPIAIGILNNFNQVSEKYLSDSLFIGELSLDGSLNKMNGVLPICLEAKKLGIKRIFLPYENRNEISVVNELEVYPANSLLEVIEHLNDSHKLIDFSNTFQNISFPSCFPFDYSEVKGQENAKRALEIAAAGNHNCLLIGPPGAGKSMLAKRLPSILPDLCFEEMLEVTKIHSIAGLLPQNDSIITTRPFRAPHYTITQTALVGGGKVPKPRGNHIISSWCSIF